MQIIKEIRLWYTRNGSILFSGKPDYIAIDGSRALVIDYKTGYLETISADKNLQLRSIAVLVKKNFPDVKEINVSIIQPNLEPGYTIAKYKDVDLDVAEKQIIKIIDAAMVEDADANPGEKQCRYCKAKPVCKEAQAESFEIIKADTATLDVSQLPDLLDRCDLADRVIKSIREAALEAVQQGEIVRGWELPKATSTRSFQSTAAVFHAVSDVIDRDVFANACDIKLGALQKAWLESTDENESKKSRLESLRARLEPVTVYTEKQIRKLRKAKQK